MDIEWSAGLDAVRNPTSLRSRGKEFRGNESSLRPQPPPLRTNEKLLPPEVQEAIRGIGRAVISPPPPPSSPLKSGTRALAGGDASSSAQPPPKAPLASKNRFRAVVISCIENANVIELDISKVQDSDELHVGNAPNAPPVFSGGGEKRIAMAMSNVPIPAHVLYR